MATVQYTIHGMSCAGCAQSIARRLLATAGVTAAEVDLNSTLANVTYDEAITNAGALVHVIEGLGFEVVNTAKQAS